MTSPKSNPQSPNPGQAIPAATVGAGQIVYYDRYGRPQMTDQAPADGDVMVWNDTSKKYVPGPGGGGSSGWDNGTTAPDDFIGEDGEYYENTTNGFVYLKVSGTWVFQGGFLLGQSFTALNSLVWDGTNKEILLTGNTGLITTADPYQGTLRVVQDITGNHTLSINGTAIADLSLTAESVTLISIYRAADSSINYIYDLTSAPIADPEPPGTPTVSSATATDMHTIVLVFNKNMTGTSAGFSFDNGAALTITGLSGQGTKTLVFTVSEVMLSTDVIIGSYNAAIGNMAQLGYPDELLASYTDMAVTNDISAIHYLTFTTRSGVIVESPAHVFTMNVGAHMLSDQSMVGDGSIQQTVGGAADETIYYALDSTDVNNDILTDGADVMIALFANKFYWREGAGGPQTSNVTWTPGDLYRISRTINLGVGTCIAEYSQDGGTTWTTLHTFSGDYHVEMWAKAMAFSQAVSVLRNPISVGMS